MLLLGISRTRMKAPDKRKEKARSAINILNINFARVHQRSRSSLQLNQTIVSFVFRITSERSGSYCQQLIENYISSNTDAYEERRLIIINTNGENLLAFVTRRKEKNINLRRATIAKNMQAFRDRFHDLISAKTPRRIGCGIKAAAFLHRAISSPTRSQFLRISTPRRLEAENISNFLAPLHLVTF